MASLTADIRPGTYNCEITGPEPFNTSRKIYKKDYRISISNTNGRVTLKSLSNGFSRIGAFMVPTSLGKETLTPGNSLEIDFNKPSEVARLQSTIDNIKCTPSQAGARRTKRRKSKRSSRYRR